jgi:hypothetical protein
LRASGFGFVYGISNLGKFIGPAGLAVIIGVSNYVNPKARLAGIVPGSTISQLGMYSRSCLPSDRDRDSRPLPSRKSTRRSHGPSRSPPFRIIEEPHQAVSGRLKRSTSAPAQRFWSAWDGTNGSNPLPSSAESAANRGSIPRPEGFNTMGSACPDVDLGYQGSPVRDKLIGMTAARRR